MTTHESKTSENPSKAIANQSFGKDCISLFPPNFKFVQPKLTVNQPNDIYEQEADKVANEVMTMQSPVIQTKPLLISSIQRMCSHCEEEQKMQGKELSGQEKSADDNLESYVENLSSGGQSLTTNIRGFYEPRVGYDFSNVKVHTDSVAARSAQSINALAYTSGNDIVFNEGQYSPGTDNGKRLLGHELTHVMQQKDRVQTKLIQRTIAHSNPVTEGEFQVDANPQNAPAGSTQASLPITIRFQPNIDAPYSNQIGLIQIVRDINSDTGDNASIASLPSTRAGNLRTTANAATGVEGDFFTDVLHNDEPANPGAGVDSPAGNALPLQYPFDTSRDAAHPNPVQPSPATPGLSRPFSSGAQGQIIGYKRSNNPADIKAAEMTDAPGSSGNRNFSFETVAKGEDTMNIYGSLHWGFEIRGGVIQNDNATVQDAQSATFDAALSLHRDFYVHEPVIFYFEFDHDVLSTTETDKIDEFLDYLHRFPDVIVTPTGFADRRGDASHNLDLSLRRSRAVETALLARGVPRLQINAPARSGATEDFTPDATTSQDEDANRRGNRRVVLTFAHPAPAGGAGAAGGAAAGAGGAP